MKRLKVTISLILKYSSLQTAADLEQKYQSIYRYIATFFYQHPYNRLNIFFPGPLLLWLDENHPEFTKLLTKMVARKQIEILGGSFYDALLPTIFPIDRSGQLELLTSEIRRIFGKRPRGAVFESSVWDNSLVPTLQNGGMEYVFLDSSLAKGRNEFVPYILNEKGKSIKVLLHNENLTFRSDYEVSPYIEKLLSESFSDELNGDLFENVEPYFSDSDEAAHVVSLKIEENQFMELVNSLWLEKFYLACREEFQDRIEICFPLEYLGSCDEFVQVFIPSGIAEKYKASSVFDYLFTHRRSKSLYNRMLYISMLLSQCKGDKSRRNAAREYLWKAQSGESYIYDSSDDEAAFLNAKIRQYAYRNLSESEKMVREADEFKESVFSFDYNGDGHEEYVCSMSHFNAVISQKAAQIFEFNVMKNSGNYADNENGRGFFLSCLFNDRQFSDYESGRAVESTVNSAVFSKKFFVESAFNPSRNEVKLLGMENFALLKDDGSVEKVPVSMIKKYVATSNGLMVQFILKNESHLPIKGKLVVESNFAQMDFSLPECNSYSLEVIHGDEKSAVLSGTEIGIGEILRNCGSLSDVSFMQITDKFNDVSFLYEPNESCDVVFMPVSSKRGTTFVASLCWNVDLIGGLEMEKTINFAVITPKKRKK
ncbi:MAG: hypothetical protein K6B43_06980 [Treponema sp.]|nr:hypothetical protein [Treponema sp.]